MAFLCAAVLVVAVPVAARTRTRRDPLLRREKPWPCGCCGRSWRTRTAFLVHDCEVR